MVCPLLFNVEIALDLLLGEGVTLVSCAVKAILTDEKPAIPEQKVPKVDLSEYDALLQTTGLREAAL